MTLVGVSLGLNIVFQDPAILALLAPALIISFVGHELAHKFLAQRNGLWAEFRTNPYGLMMTVISVVLPIKFLAPGQTNIQGAGRKDVLGSIALVGPGLNIALGFACFVLAKMTGGILSSSMILLAFFNSWLALFNLIPFGTFDGIRVFEWDKTRWAIAFAASILLSILAYFPNIV